jgi:4-amino-4-deoxy-L-arabinose transferase-like glycosyltransferase
MSQHKHLSGRQFKIRPVHWVLFLTLIGFGLRLQKLGLQPLWGDEGWSLYFATQSLPQLLALTAIDIHPPLYYILLKAWLFVVGVGAEEARLFSVMVGTLLIPVVSVLGHRLFNQRIGVIAAAVTAVMPMAIYYSQEVRMYGLVTLLGALSVYFFIKNEDVYQRNTKLKDRTLAGPPHHHPYLLAYVFTSVAALYTMYYAAFFVLFQLLYRLLTCLRQARLTVVLGPFVYIGLLYLPWLIYAGPRLVNYVQNKRDVEEYIPLSLLRFFGDHFVAFSLGHILTDLRGYVWLALIMVIVASLGFVVTLSSKNKQHLLLYLYLLAPLALGYAINLIFPFTPRFFERTLLLAAPAYWLFIAVGIIWLWDRQYLLAGTVVVAMFVVVAIGLFSFYTTPRYPHEDYRPLLTDIAARATPEDTVLASYQWQLGFYRAYLPPPRPKLFTVPGWGQGWSSQATENPQLISDLTGIFARSPRLWFPAYQARGHIWEDEAETAISSLGYPTLLQWYGPQTKLTLAGSAQMPPNQVPPANFENRLSLLEATVGGEAYEAGRDIVPVELIWQKIDDLGSEHRVNLRLVDATGRTWATRDSQPRAGQTSFADISSGDILTDHHGLLTPAGAPLGRYRLLLSVRQVSNAHPLDLLDEAGQPLGPELPLAEIDLITPRPPVKASVLPVQTAVNATFGQQLRLVGYSLGDEPFKAGESLPLTLFWESLVDHPDSLTVLVQLQDISDQTVVSYQKEPIWPTNAWEQGTILRDPHDFILPATLPPAEYRLVVGLLTAKQNRLEVDGDLQLRPPSTGPTFLRRRLLRLS